MARLLMQDGQDNGPNERALRGLGGVAQFAADVVARLVDRDSLPETSLREELIERFMTAVVCPDIGSLDALKSDLRRARLSATTFADRYIPEVARRLGQAWVDDCMSFADVTMGSARLQAILREIGADWAADGRTDDRGTVLLIIPAGEQHTLGALVLMGQLRRRGVSVCLRIGPSEADLRNLLAQRGFDGALVSGAQAAMLPVCTMLVRLLKDLTTGRMPVAVGGAMLGLLPQPLHIAQADAVTNDLTDALVALGMAIPAQNYVYN
jgi:MerR family transcriptional regulator, light-induced transcriptional regulator